MADTITVYCAHCGKLIGQVTYVPGIQYIGCTCGNQTKVIIDNDGRVRTGNLNL